MSRPNYASLTFDQLKKFKFDAGKFFTIVFNGTKYFEVEEAVQFTSDHFVFALQVKQFHLLTGHFKF